MPDKEAKQRPVLGPVKFPRPSLQKQPSWRRRGRNDICLPSPSTVLFCLQVPGAAPGLLPRSVYFFSRSIVYLSRTRVLFFSVSSSQGRPRPPCSLGYVWPPGDRNFPRFSPSYGKQEAARMFMREPILFSPSAVSRVNTLYLYETFGPQLHEKHNLLTNRRTTQDMSCTLRVCKHQYLCM